LDVRTQRRHPVRRRGGFQPPCCPNPRCRFHHPDPRWRFIRFGHFRRPSDRRRIQTFRCSHCHRRFSTQTFSHTYWLRHRHLPRAVATLVTEGAALRQIARSLQTSHSTVIRLVARLGRHCLLFHTAILRDQTLREPLVIDGFESFEFSQFFPFHANLAVGAHSWFLYDFTDSPLRRKGTMTDRQKLRRAELERLLGRPDPKAVETGIHALLSSVLTRHLPSGTLILHSDDHPAYRRALRRVRAHPKLRTRIRHHVTSSTLRRTCRNPLFPVNLADLLIRHANANHRRETIAFSKRRQAALERLALFAVWRNAIKRRRENGPATTAAMEIGVASRPLTWRDVFRTRLFPRHHDLSRTWRDYYWRRVKTAVFGAGQAEHRCRYAF
jgi:hypothetical protein